MSKHFKFMVVGPRNIGKSCIVLCHGTGFSCKGGVNDGNNGVIDKEMEKKLGEYSVTLVDTYVLYLFL